MIYPAPAAIDGEFETAWKAAPDVAPEPEGDGWGVDPTAEALAGGTKVAGLFDFIKPAGDGVSGQTHKAMREAGVGPYEIDRNSVVLPARADDATGIRYDSSVGDQIRAKRAADRQNQKDILLIDIKKANPRGDPAKWNARAEERLKEQGL